MNDDFLVIEKPVNMSVFKNETGYINLPDWCCLYFGKELEPLSFPILQASGLVILKKLNSIINCKLVFSYILLTNNKINSDSPQFKLIREHKNTRIYELRSTLSNMKDVIGYAKDLGISILKSATNPERLFIHCKSIEINGKKFESDTIIPDSFLTYQNTPDSFILPVNITIERRLPLLAKFFEAYRLLHREELPGVALSIDFYANRLHIQNYSLLPAEGIYKKYHNIITLYEDRLTIIGGCIKNMMKDPHNSSLIGSYYEWGDIPESFPVTENRCLYDIRLNKNQHTGLFLDQRDNRAYIKQISQNKRVLNLFSFTCSFSVSAVINSAEVVFSVDLARSSLKRGRINFELNGLTNSGIGKFIETDVIAWLEKNSKKIINDSVNYKLWDIIICDPPVFAMTGKKVSFHIEDKWEYMAEKISLILENNGIALFSNNHKDGDSHFYKQTLMKYFGEVTERKPSIDFPETGYNHIRIFYCRFPFNI